MMVMMKLMINSMIKYPN